jgi:hypothetical protein
MDFIEGLPNSSGFSVIMVVVDRFTKYSHFYPLKCPYTAASVAVTFLNQVVKLHGLPKSIVSDRDKVFTSNFWKALFGLLDIKLSMSSAYHPQTCKPVPRDVPKVCCQLNTQTVEQMAFSC